MYLEKSKISIGGKFTVPSSVPCPTNWWANDKPLFACFADPNYMICVVLSNASETCAQPSLHTGLFTV